jgi:hypothetical protein
MILKENFKKIRQTLKMGRAAPIFKLPLFFSTRGLWPKACQRDKNPANKKMTWTP